ncbi:MAG: ubiquinone/menaquinone biosynthesis C-methylase UbiE [Planctomycetota bacterium]|jgi:ubiquinone/menaquinone biosynthesis C-methylase UbiE
MLEKYKKYKERYFKNLEGRVVELGAGYGVNAEYHSRQSRILLVEPETEKHGKLNISFSKRGMAPNITWSTLEDLKFPDNSIDVIMDSLVLCSVVDPQKTLAEIHRVLKSGGRYVFLEHIAGATGGTLYWWQNSLNSIWKWATGGCHCTRSLDKAIRQTGFSEVDMEYFTSHKVFPLMRRHIVGVVIK